VARRIRVDLGFIITYYDPQNGHIVDRTHNVWMQTKDIQHRMRRILTARGSYLSVRDHFDVALQFIAKDDGTVRIDRPVPAQRGSMVKDTSLEECIELVGRIGPSFADLEIPGMAFEHWT
jgi:hypothetical protein